MAEAQNVLFLLFYHEATGRIALSRNSGGRTAFLRIDRLSAVGRPAQLIASGQHLAIAGSSGVLLIQPHAAGRFERPRVEISLTADGQPVNGRKLPNGSHVLDYSATSAHPAIPFELSYRVNGGEWRMLAPGSGSLPFSGQGSFQVEFRPVFADGTPGDTARFGFSISPP